MDKWKDTANRLWLAVFAKVKALDAEGETLQAIADKVGVKSRQNVKAWLSGARKGGGIAFPELMTYAERLGIDYRNYFPGGEPPVMEFPDCATCKKLLAKEKENQKLQQQVDKMRLELAKRDGMVEALERQLEHQAEQAWR